MKPQRIRDPLHDLIEFDATAFEQSLWDVLNSTEFQRLRRIKQLGFSELVYPGATHTRFAHSVGVFHTARELSRLIKTRLGDAFDPDRARTALAAALVHDVGHGPFSHAFEDSVKQLDSRRGIKNQKRHESWTAEIIRGETEIGRKLENGLGKEMREAIAVLLLQETPTDIYSAIVSSQFDADRLDYVRRDRLMTGAQHGGFDFSWLIANLEVDKVPLSTDGDTFANVDCLILGHKAFQAAESYVLGLFHLYFAVYFHKATRSAEKMLTEIFVRLGGMVLDKKLGESGLFEGHPLVEFISHRSLPSYLDLDDSVVWGSLPLLSRAADPMVKELSNRLLTRRLYKAVDISARFRGKGDETSVAKFRALLTDAKNSGEFGECDIFEDTPKRNPYKRRGYNSPEGLSKVLIRRSSGGAYEDLASISSVVGALQEQSIYRVYVRDEVVREKILNIAKGVE